MPINILLPGKEVHNNRLITPGNFVVVKASNRIIVDGAEQFGFPYLTAIFDLGPLCASRKASYAAE
ncbi:hypothetical protein D3C75_1188060 [compost metagenome]